MKEKLDSNDLYLVNFARDLLLKSPDRNKFNVAAAVRSADGEMFGAYNSFKGYWSGSVCAEVGCLAVATSSVAPKRFEAVLFAAVKFDADQESLRVANTCGRCLQWIVDYFPDADCIIAEKDGSLAVASARDLLPYGYNDSRGIIE